jgi:uncharacterized protein YciI
MAFLKSKKRALAALIGGLAFGSVSNASFAVENSMNSPNNGPKSVFVVIHKSGPKWKAGVSFRDQEGVGAHIIHYRKWYEEGKIQLGGPYLDNSGGMMITVPGLSVDDVEAFAKADPSVDAGLLTYEIKPWMIAMEKD